MSIFLILLAAVCLIGIKFSGKDFRKDYMSVETTTAINGVFTFLVLIHHIKSSAAYDGGGITDEIFSRYIALGQLIVVTFFFYSGYGIAESIRNKPGYIMRMPKNRILKLWINLALALIPYIILNICIDREMTAKQIVLSLVGWDSVGNSNWFMFVIFMLYIIVFVSFAVCKSKFIPGAAITTLLTAGLTAALILAKKDSYWWTTAVFFPLGMWFSIIKPTAEKIIQKSNAVYALCFAASAVLFAGTHLLYCKTQKIIFFMMSGAFMMAFIIIALMKFTVNNKILSWLGKNVFSIYILQRIPIIIIENIDVTLNKYLYTVIIIVSAAAIAFVFGKLLTLINKKLFAPSKLTTK